MREIQLTQGKVALVDDADFEWLNNWKWYAHKNGKTVYAHRNSKTVDGRRVTIAMHCVIMGCPPKGFEIDHCSGNSLNNQRHNLRFVTHRQNTQNKKNIDKSSQFPGVSWIERDQIFQAKIQIGGKHKNLGSFLTELQAFQAYQQAVESLGETVIDISHDTAIQQRSIS